MWSAGSGEASGLGRALWEEARQSLSQRVLLPQILMERPWQVFVVLGGPLWIHLYGGPVTLSEQRDHSPECAHTPHPTETVCNHHWTARSPHLSLSEFLCYPENRETVTARGRHTLRHKHSH